MTSPAVAPLRTALSGLAATFALAMPACAEAPSYCGADETIIFSCDLGSHTASVCASRDSGPGEASLQYRFGHLDKVLVNYPPEGTPPGAVFSSGMISYPAGASIWLRFTREAVRNTVFIAVGDWIPGRVDLIGGIVAETEGKPPEVMACRGKPTYDMHMTFFREIGITEGGEFELPAEVIPKK